MKKVIIIPDSFKGSMTSREAADILFDVISARGDCYPIAIPIADGGEGSTDCILNALGGAIQTCTVSSPENKPIQARYGITPDSVAVLEIAESSGITKQSSYNATAATTYGFGEMISDALSRGIREFILCLGGSATTDCGAGMAAALGAHFYDKDGKIIAIPSGDDLVKICSVDISEMDKRISESSFTVMCDVDNPLYGANGAAYIFAPQKGANSREVELLDEGLRAFEQVLVKLNFPPSSEVKSAGAAGGAGYGCAVFFGSKTKSGIDAILDLYHFDELAADASLIVTGEGRLDAQSLMGKAVGGIRDRSGTIPMVVFCGSCELDEATLASHSITAIEIGRGLPKEESKKNGSNLLREYSQRFFNGKE